MTSPNQPAGPSYNNLSIQSLTSIKPEIADESSNLPQSVDNGVPSNTNGNNNNINTSIPSTSPEQQKQLPHTAAHNPLYSQFNDLFGIPTRKYYAQDRAGSSPATSKDLLGVSSIKTHYPTEEEFKDPYTYIRSLEESDKENGAVKIVPPSSWDPKFVLDLKKFKFRAVKQSLKKATTDYDEKVEFYRDLLNFHTARGHPIQRLPSIDKKVLDLFNLRNSVRAKGGFTVVCGRKMWAQIGRDLGYTGRIMTSLSSSLKLAYMKILSAYDEYTDKLAASESNPSSELNEQQKRPLEGPEQTSENNTAKRVKRSPEIALVTNSRQVFGRQKDILKSKGFRTNFESYTEEKHGITFADEYTYPYYDAYFWHRGMEVLDYPYPGSDVTREYYFQQFYDIHLKNSKTLSVASEQANIAEFWRIMKEKDNFNVETALDLPTRVYGSGFATTNKVEQGVSIDDITHPWNLNNLPLNEKGYLRYLPDDSDGLTRPKLTVSMMHSVQSWGVEDHFLSLADYLHIGAFKVWYFIHPADQTKYEDLLKLKVQEHEESVGEQNLDGFSESITNDIMDGIKQSDTQRKRESTLNAKFDRFYEHDLDGVRLNSDFLLSPEILKENGIRVKHVIQRPGEFVIKFPGTYSTSVSLGGSLSEKVNFATLNWFHHASYGGLWFENQRLLPKFSIIRLLTSVIEENKDPEVLKSIGPLFHSLVEKEILLRTNLKAQVSNLKIVQNKFDYIADDTLRECFPTKIVVYDGNDSFILDPYTFLVFWSDKIRDLKAELHIFYSDDKLKSYQRTVSTFAQNPTDWIEKFDTLINSTSKPSLKQLRSIYQDGERLPFDISQIHELKEYLDFANDWVEKVQELITCKQKCRTRNRNKLSEPAEKLLDFEILDQLTKDLPNLTFTCPEIDQLVELCAEIHQYESSVRVFLNEKDHTYAEFNHMIDLGKSFGVKLKSVEFLERIISRLLWKQRVTDTLNKSTNLYDYTELLDEGYEVCGSRDDGLLTIVEQKIKNGRFLGARIKHELSSPKFTLGEIEELFSRVKDVPIDPKIIRKLNEIKETHFVAAEQRDTLYRTITLNSIDLLNLRSQRDKKFLRDGNLRSPTEASFNQDLFDGLFLRFNGGIDDPRPKYSDAKAILERSRGLLSMAPSSPIDGYLRQVEEWLRKSKRLFGKTNAPFSVLRQHLETLLNKAATPLNLEDRYISAQKPSVNDAANESGSDDEIVLVDLRPHAIKSPLFCVCRRPESGVMIQCEKCSEWYHCKCLKIGRGRAKRPDDYICPVCDYRLDLPREYNSPKIEDLEKVVIDGALLELNPDELDIIRSIWEHSHKFRKFLRSELKWDGDQIVEDDINKVKFYLRKLEGSCVLLLNEYNQLRQLVWKYDPICSVEPPLVAETISKTKRVRKVVNARGDNESETPDNSSTSTRGTPLSVPGSAENGAEQAGRNHTPTVEKEDPHQFEEVVMIGMSQDSL